MNTSTEGFQQCYNAQTAVDEAHQIIVATQVGAQASDQGRLMPLLDEVSDSFGVEPEVVLADAGYCNEADLVALEERGIDGYVALGREGKARVAVDPHTRAATHRMGEKLARAKGKAQYAKRKWIPRDRTAGSRRCWGSDGSACGAWTRCGANGTWCALR